MLSTRVIACLDVHNGRTVKGVNFVDLKDAGDPVEQANFYSKTGADEICFLDISATYENRKTMFDVISKTAETCFVPLTVGGGVNNLNDFRELLKCGADKVSVNSSAVSNPKIIKNFRDEYKDIIIKPLYGNGGQGVFHVLPNDENFNSILEMFFTQNNEPLMIQEYLSDVRSGDKRIILVNGEVVGAINRIPKKGESRSNMHVGGKPEKTTLTKRDKFICKEISQSLKDKELYFVGIDIIGDYITEINVTSPTGIREIKSYDSVAIEEIFWNFIENKLSF